MNGEYIRMWKGMVVAHLVSLSIHVYGLWKYMM